jgi:site-specific recombinase XerD
LKIKLREKLIRIGQEAGIKDLTTLHSLRHTFASQLVMKGVDLATLKALPGHSDIQTTMIYAHLAPIHLAGAVEKLKFT